MSALRAETERELALSYAWVLSGFCFSDTLKIEMFFFGSVIILALLLFFPVSKLMWVLSIRRLERKFGRETSERERYGQLSRARFLAVFVVVIFSLLFNYYFLGGG
uniref:Uncharacterized protein n=1 Tax=Candidatus Kentrum sp. TUN TaxID=2126343 RepID=A0A450Z9N3_9GAMM|nr:MAG: hypothetical protein BECKTUN1418E_GA0071001_100337 [Candidatus Kentron sp. TUN]VFK51738.1 MAG: hypothetical protein BECKTUN1418F_GA0071002_100337 [Candidatus Kentron sp. TUN]VFK56600.1 MAG: hypothetical protein BECKTUN1418D_GA0071000_105010 [Candidatus Kentron sp. TUN]